MLKKLFGSLAVSLVLTLCLAGPAQCQKARAGKASSGGAQRVEALNDAILGRIVQISDMHWHKGEYNHIINLNHMIIAGQPDNLEAYGNSGWLLWSMNRDTEALALYEKGLRANPDTAYMYDELGQYYFMRKKDYPKAIRYYEKAVRLKDCPPKTLHMLAHSYEKNKQFDKSLATWKLAVERSPGNGPAKTNLERVKQLVAQQSGGR